MEPNQLPPLKEMPGYLLGNPAISSRPVAFRPRLTAGLALSLPFATIIPRTYPNLS
jgi:hypothetical protein